MPYKADQQEKEILEFWKKDNTFEKSVEQRPKDKPYAFYDGPPFATGLPHYGHILSSVIKDVVPRYWTMKGYRVRRRWGWDCHGLPIESLIEKELGISGKKDIEEKVGVEAFNEKCRSAVLQYANDWKEMVEREGRWIEFDNSYKTMDSTYMESVWWALKTAWDKGLIYEGRKVLQYCPRCETPVSKAETNMDDSYKNVTEEAVTVSFKVTSTEFSDGNAVPGNTFVLAWTTTPWTLPGNVALAVGPDIDYQVVKFEGSHYIVAKERLMHYFDGKEFEVVSDYKGRELDGLEYEPLFELSAMRETGKKAWYVAPADFVTTEDGTGIVHTAVMYGEDDYELGMKLDLPVVPMLDQRGHFTDVVPDFIQGEYLKKAEKPIKKDLEERGLLFEKSQNTHSYPHCWRCDTPLFYNAISAWFINIQKLKPRLLELNEKINWHPDHLKHGRFKNILETAPDWNISRNRYWATPLPFWKCDNEDCDERVCVGSVAELKEKAQNYNEVYSSDKVEEIDLHKHNMDKVVLQCTSCKGSMTRIPEVIDCWVESGSMPFAEFHYPFENKETFEGRYPGQYIAEYIAQTRAWFYYMHVMGVMLFDDVSFENVVTTGTILNEKGEKLSKSKKNYPDPWGIINQYGVDALRYYLMTSVVMQAENLYFNEREVREIYNKVVNTLWNVHTFYLMYAEEVLGDQKVGQSANVLDTWILARLYELVENASNQMDNYDTIRAARPMLGFIADLSQWYVRRSRDRFKGDDEADKQSAIVTLQYVLETLSKVMAPFTPFIADKIYLDLTKGEESVHLQMWPVLDTALQNNDCLKEMEAVRKVVEMGMSLRKEHGQRVRQPLSKFVISGSELGNQYLDIISDELNVKTVTCSDSVPESLVIKEDGDLKVGLDIAVTEQLEKEGLVREIIRAVSQLRKDQGLTRDDSISISYKTDDSLLLSVLHEFETELKESTRAVSITPGEEGEALSLDDHAIILKVEKV